MSTVISEWHRILEEQDAGALDRLLAEDVVFHSPVVHTPQHGRPITRLYLTAAIQTLNTSGTFRYLREVIDGHHAVLEFETEIDGILINGVDMIEWNEAEQIVDFKVMVRPLKAVNAIHEAMGRMLEQMKPRGQ